MSFRRIPTQPPAAHDFARVLTSDGPSHVGIVLERARLDPEHRVLVEFGLREAPLFAIGETVTVGFMGDAEGESEIRARVLFRAETERMRRYEFHLLRGALEHDEDRRRHPRQTAETDIGATLRSASSDTDLPVFVRNLSLHGIALEAELWVDRALLEIEDIELTIDLEDNQPPVGLSGRLVYRRLFEDRVHFGIEFQGQSRALHEVARLDRFMGGEGLRQAS